MKITVEECLELEILKTAKVVAGNKALNNKVKGVSVIDASDLREVSTFLAKKGEIALSGFFGSKNDVSRQMDLVKALSNAGNSALILFYVGAMTTHLSREVVDAADQVGLPLIVLPENKNISYSDVIHELMEKILYGDNFTNRLINLSLIHISERTRLGMISYAVFCLKKKK